MAANYYAVHDGCDGRLIGVVQDSSQALAQWGITPHPTAPPPPVLPLPPLPPPPVPPGRYAVEHVITNRDDVTRYRSGDFRQYVRAGDRFAIRSGDIEGSVNISFVNSAFSSLRSAHPDTPIHFVTCCRNQVQAAVRSGGINRGFEAVHTRWQSEPNVRGVFTWEFGPTVTELARHVNIIKGAGFPAFIRPHGDPLVGRVEPGGNDVGRWDYGELFSRTGADGIVVNCNHICRFNHVPMAVPRLANQTSRRAGVHLAPFNAVTPEKCFGCAEAAWNVGLPIVSLYPGATTTLDQRRRFLQLRRDAL